MEEEEGTVVAVEVEEQSAGQEVMEQDGAVAEEEVVKSPQGKNGDQPNFLDDEDSEEDDFVVTIGDIKTNLPYQKNRGGPTGGGTIDLDSNPTLKDGTPIYDLDLATMEDKPWRKPGADITDYFNYGFNEETWNQYCERQRKFRVEFGNDQSAINRAILSNIQLSGPAQVGLSTFAGGRQLVSLSGGGQDSKLQQTKVQKIVVDLSKPPPAVLGGDQVPMIRTVIDGTGIVRQESANQIQHLANTSGSIQLDQPPSPTAIEGGAIPSLLSLNQQPLQQPPLVETPPPGTSSAPISVIGSAPPTAMSLQLDFSKPPPSFDPAIPPPLAAGQSQPNQQQIPPTAQQPQMIQPTAPSTAMGPPKADLPPGMEDDDLEGPPGAEGLAPSGLSRINFGQPPQTSQFSYTPNPAMGAAGQPYFGASNMHMGPPQQFNPRPPPLFHSFRNPFGGGGRFHHAGGGYRGRGMGLGMMRDRSPDSDSESRRRKRRSRSRSRSPSTSERRNKERDEKRKERSHKDKDREKEGKKKKDKEKKDKHSSSSRHRSPSLKKERRSTERERDPQESRRRSSPSRKEKESSSRISIKLERKSPE